MNSMPVNMPRIFFVPGTSYAKEFEKAKELLNADHRVANVYQLITKDVNKVATSTVKMEILAKTIKAEDFHKEYPNLGGLVKFKYRKALVRRKLLHVSEIAIIKCLGQHLPHLCAKIIINYLNNHDLENLVEATHC